MKKDKNFARQVINKDKDINKLDCEINEKVILLIMKQQPIASDLRMMMAALKLLLILKEWVIMLQVSLIFV